MLWLMNIIEKFVHKVKGENIQLVFQMYIDLISSRDEHYTKQGFLTSVGKIQGTMLIGMFKVFHNLCAASSSERVCALKNFMLPPFIPLSSAAVILVSLLLSLHTVPKCWLACLMCFITSVQRHHQKGFGCSRTLCYLFSFCYAQQL